MKEYYMPASGILKCPYCNTIQEHKNLIDTDRHEETFVRTCCIEEGGCDKQFVVKVKRVFEIEVASIGYFSPVNSSDEIPF